MRTILSLLLCLLITGSLRAQISTVKRDNGTYAGRDATTKTDTFGKRA